MIPNRPCHPASPIRRVQLASAERCDATAAYDPASACHQAVTAATLRRHHQERRERHPRRPLSSAFPMPSRRRRRDGQSPPPSRTARGCASSRSPTGSGRSRSALLQVPGSPARWRRAPGPKRQASCTLRRSRCHRSRPAVLCCIAPGSSISQRAPRRTPAPTSIAGSYPASSSSPTGVSRTNRTDDSHPISSPPQKRGSRAAI